MDEYFGDTANANFGRLKTTARPLFRAPRPGYGKTTISTEFKYHPTLKASYSIKRVLIHVLSGHVLELIANILWIFKSSRIFENIPQNGPEYPHRNLTIAMFLVTVVKKNIGGLLSWLVSLSSSVPELTRHGLGRGLHVNPWGGGRLLQKRGTVCQSYSVRVSALVISAFSLSCQILSMFEAHWPMKAFP